MSERIFIAEVKPFSPYDGPTGSTWEELFEIADEHGDWLSIHTSSKWNGSFELLKRARSMTDKPILAKGYHTHDRDIQQAVDAGANHVLVVGRVPGVHLEQCIIEPEDLNQLTGELIDLPEDQKIMWNQRDLRNGSRKTEAFQQARRLWSGWLGLASMIEYPTDIRRGADAFIVGAHLPDFVAHYSRV